MTFDILFLLIFWTYPEKNQLGNIFSGSNYNAPGLIYTYIHTYIQKHKNTYITIFILNFLFTNTKMEPLAVYCCRFVFTVSLSLYNVELHSVRLFKRRNFH